MGFNENSLIIVLFAAVVAVWMQLIIPEFRTITSVSQSQKLANWGIMGIVNYDSLLANWSIPTPSSKRNLEFLSEVDYIKGALSYDQLEANQCTVLMPKGTSRYPYGYCRGPDGLPRVLAYVTGVILDGTNELPKDIMLVMFSSKDGKSIDTSNGVVKIVANSDGSIDSSLFSFQLTGYGEVFIDDCVDDPSVECAEHVKHMSELSEEEQKFTLSFITKDRSRRVLGVPRQQSEAFFNRVNNFQVVNTLSIELMSGTLSDQGYLSLSRTIMFTISTGFSYGKVYSATQLLLLVLPLYYYNTHNFPTKYEMVNARRGIVFSRCSSYVLSMRLGASPLLVGPFIYYLYHDTFVVSYLVSQTITRSYSLWVYYIYFFGSIYVVTPGAVEIAIKVVNGQYRFKKLHRFIAVFWPFGYLVLITIFLLTYMTPSIDLGTACLTFQYQCNFGATCCTKTFAFTWFHVVIVSIIVSVGVVTKYIEMRVWKRVQANEPLMVLGMTSIAHESSKMNCFEKHCLSTRCNMISRDWDPNITTDTGAITSNEGVQWYGYVNLSGLGIVRIKDLALIWYSYITPFWMTYGANLSVIVWETNSSGTHAGTAKRVYINEIGTHLKKTGIQFRFNCLAGYVRGFDSDEVLLASHEDKRS